MRWLDRHSFGLVGQIIAILLLALAIEFGASTLLYERASQFAVREDEAHRLAEHLVVSRRVLGDARPAQRPAVAEELTTDRYVVRWAAGATSPPQNAAAMASMRRQILGWEPTLASNDLRLGLMRRSGRAIVGGGLRLPDGSWLRFSMRDRVTSLNSSATRIAIALIPALLLMALGGLLIRRMLSPLRRLAQAVDRFDGDDPIAVPEAGPGEVRRVTRAFNDLQSRIRTLVTERTQALAAVSHDLRTPLARINLRADTVAEQHIRAAIQHDVGEMNAMVGSLLAFLGGNDDPDPATAIDVAVLLATIADMQQDAGHAVTYIGPAHAEMTTRPLALRRGINNLVDNAVRFGQQVDLTLAISDDIATITVDDDGPGIPEEMMAKVLEPFVRLDDARSRTADGFGLGLAIVLRAATLLGGSLALANRTLGGLRATLVLPTGSTLPE